MFISAGGKFKEEHQVTDIVPGEMVTVKTNKGSFSTKRLVITAGPWTNTLLQSISLKLPLKVWTADKLCGEFVLLCLYLHLYMIGTAH